MKKLITLAIVALAASAFAKGSQSDSQELSTQVDFKTYPRVLLFGPERNAITAEGEMLVCPTNATATWTNKNVCSDANGKNAWIRAENALPGYVLKKYEYRLVGPGGYPNLILYFVAK